MRRIWTAAAVSVCLLALSGCASKSAGTEPAAAADVPEKAAAKSREEETAKTPGETAAAAKTVPAADVVQEGMVPVYGDELKDGTYAVQVDSSSSMFRITKCELTVKDGKMSAVMTMGGTGYLKLFMGAGEEALKASEDAMIPYQEQADGTHTFTVPVEALDLGIACSAFSKNKETWYDRTLVFRADSLPAEAFADGALVTAGSLRLSDGVYTVAVTLNGGSGRASVESPASLSIENGTASATIVWGSPNYDYMKVDGEKFEAINESGNSTFTIPVLYFNRPMSVIADTTAMSEPHEIEYTLTFDSSTIAEGASLSSLELEYADQFSVDFYEDGYARIEVADGQSYLVVPEGRTVPENLPADVTVLKQPVENIYLAATSAMDYFCELDSLKSIALSGTDASGWYLKEAKDALLSGQIQYAGKYSAPDYELILLKECGMALESTMIYHSPEVKEQLERLGIPVFVERSSYESHPLGRMEWIKLYGVLLGKEKEAAAIFDSVAKKVEEAVLAAPENPGSVAFFYIGANGSVNVRKPGDYITKMIEMAGGEYVLSGIKPESDNALSTMNMQMEAFYAAAKDADYLIYSSTIDGGMDTLDELLSKSELLKDFKAVKSGNVWCTDRNFFQESMGIGDMILDIHTILTEPDPAPEELTYLHRLE